MKFLAYLLPYTKYLHIILLVLAFGGGVWITREHYQARIQVMQTENNRALLNYQNRILEKDSEYRYAFNSVQNQLKVIQGKLKDEIANPLYLCPIPDNSIRLLNDAIRAKPDNKPSK